MKNRPTTSNIVSEWEDSVLFDADDPDFCNLNPNETNVLNNVVASSVESVSVATANIFMPPPPILDSIASGSFNFKGKFETNSLLYKKYLRKWIRNKNSL